MILLSGYALFFLDNILRELLRWKNKAHIFVESSDDRKSSLFLIAYLVIVPLTPLITLYNFGEFQNQTLQEFGIVILLIGVTVHLIAVETLKQHYSGVLITSKDQPFVKTGPYKMIRHPGYLGNLLIGLGFGLTSANWLSIIVIIIAFTIVYSYRIHQEETMLIRKFGGDYEKYTKETKRLIPRIY